MKTDFAVQTRKHLIAGESVAFLASAPSEERTVPAAWVVEAARAGASVSLANARVVGRLDLHNVHVSADVRIVSSTFVDFVDFSYAVFDRAVYLERCTFERGTSFDSVRLRSDVSLAESTFGARKDADPEASDNLFNDAEILGVLNARSVRFAGDAARFVRARFGSSVFFDKARFECNVDLSDISVTGDLELGEATFVRSCNLNSAKVRGRISLYRARFARRANITLSNTEAMSGILLSDAVFLGAFEAPSSRFGSISGSRTVFAGSLLLNDATVAGFVNLGKARFGRFAELQRLSVNGELDVTEAFFKKPLRVDEAIVGKTLIGVKARFRRNVTFNRLQAGALNLQRARFHQGAVVSNARVGELSFDRARCYGPVDCSATTVSGTLNFGGVRIRAKNNTALNLQGVDVGKIAWFDKAWFVGKVDAIGLRVEKQFSWRWVLTFGDVDFYELNVKRGMFVRSARFYGELKLDRSLLEGEVYFGGTVCRRAVSFNTSTVAALHFGKDIAPHDKVAQLLGGISLIQARLGYLGLQDVTVGGAETQVRPSGGQIPPSETRGVIALFNHCEISGMNFSGATFDCSANFYGAIFQGEALFQRVTFGAPEPTGQQYGQDAPATTFVGCTFKRRAAFIGVHFKASVDFSYARFEAAAMFRAWFAGKALFDMVQFSGAAEFSDTNTVAWEVAEAMWVNSPDLRGSRFGEASFLQARFESDARFDSAKFGGSFNLRDAEFTALYLPNDNDAKTESDLLPPRIGLVGCRYERVILKHPLNLLLLKHPVSSLSRGRETLRLMEGYDREPFAQLEHALRRAGDDQEADRIYLAGRRAEARQKPPAARLLDRSYGALVNYGVRPWRLAAFAILLVLAGTWFFCHPGTVELKDKAQRGQSPYAASWAEALSVATAQFLPVSLPITEHLIPSLQPVEIAVPVPKRGRKLLIRLRPTSVATVLQLSGWLLVPIGVAAMTGVLMRKKK